MSVLVLFSPYARADNLFSVLSAELNLWKRCDSSICNSIFSEIFVILVCNLRCFKFGFEGMILVLIVPVHGVGLSLILSGCEVCDVDMETRIWDAISS